ncbi:MAG: amidase family protein [Alphaproteobacteria bacterium]|nr:amidase family protein [Alphaproteobacteria bacterium]
MANTKMQAFPLEEATIDDLHAAICSGETTVAAVVERYLARVRAYNGVSSMLVTADCAPVAEAPGVVRAGSPLKFPTQTVKASAILPDLDKYQGPPLEFGRMEPTASKPDVQQQFGMIVGIPNAGQVNGIGTLNIRGERSVTCWGDLDKHPSLGPLPPAAPPVCEFFRQQPDALERAAELDKAYGKNPDLEKMPMYGVVFSFKDPFDTTDMRSTGGGDARYDIDFPARDHVLVEQLRNKGAIIFAKAVNTEYNGRAGDPGGRHKPDRMLPSTLGFQRSTWAGNPSNPYDTTRSASLGSSSGSGVSVSMNFVMASLGEETRASCRGPSNHNSIALILPHKAMLGFDGGAIGADIYCDRSGIHARKVGDCAKILDALKDPEQGYYDPRDPFTTVPRSSVLPAYSGHAKSSGAPGSLKGVRLGVIRESMVYPKGSRTEQPIVDAAKAEIKSVLAAHLGVTLVESGDPLWTPDPDVEPMTADYRIALARLVPVFMPDLLFRVKGDGTPVFPDFAAAVVPTEFAPGKIFGSGKMQPIDYCVEMAEGRIAPPRNLDLATVQNQEMAMAFRFHISQYLTRRAADWKAKGFGESLADWAQLNARSKFWGDDQRAAFKNWEEVADPRNPHGSRQGVNERIMLRELLRRADMMVTLENKLDALVRLHTPWPPGLIGHAYQYDIASNLRPESLSGPNAGLTEVLIPAGYVTTAYDPVYKLTPDGKRYVSQASDKPTAIPAPGLPFSLVFRAEPGREDVLLKVASAYEAASQRRVPPPDFPPL